MVIGSPISQELIKSMDNDVLKKFTYLYHSFRRAEGLDQNLIERNIKTLETELEIRNGG